MKKIHWQAVLMIITILGITGFQAWWLKQNYDREKRTLSIKTETAFHETIRRLQTAKLKLDKFYFPDSLPNRKVKIYVEPVGIPRDFKTNIVSTINVLKDKLMDSLKKEGDEKYKATISMDNRMVRLRRDSSGPVFEEGLPGEKEGVFKFLYRVDSLQDTLKLKEITTSYAQALKEEKTDVPFSISRLDSVMDSDGPGTNQITVGFAHPVTYKLHLGNTFPYLLRQISMPILFSLFLIGFTILSFVLLYRNLLRQRKLAVLKNDFISNVTHELKTPIATVGVAIEALRNFNALQDPQRTKEYLDISSNELQRLSLLVDKVLKLSMFEQKEIELKKETFDLKQLTEEVMNTMKLQFEKYGAKVNMQTEGDRFFIEADKLHITSVIYNLLDNALKYSKESPVIEVLLKSYEEYIALSVKDNGIGIPAEYKGKVFDKFFRVPTGDKHNVKGYGLGLSYVSEVAKHHMGFSTVESEPGKGSIFTVNIPYKEAPVIHYGDHRKIVKVKTKIGN
ncbi:MAG TPA: HAMP domain-containing sensor histidine kinase [Chitinophagaceae bacterium]|nr:HAMP domain-containing sensor histidine kinase [Chitinophagaceae bacterium]